MAICPHCQTTGPEEFQPCPTGDGYYLVSEGEYHSREKDPWLGRKIGGRFVVASVLGQGSMGEVYKAYQEQVDRMVAVKLFDVGKMSAGSSTSRDRFVQEAKVLAKLSHPNCVTLYDFGFDENREFLYIAMEYVGGISLRRAVRRGLKVDAIIEILRQVLKALREAHALNIVHRDLKPENIILSYRRTSDEQIVKVLDFGIAKLLHGEDTARTMAGLLFGTPAYMSPEQCRGETEVTPATDIYSLGCMAFEMLTGNLPFEADYPQEMVRLHQEAPIPPLRVRGRQSMPEGLDAFVLRSMSKLPGDRFANAAVALGEFEKIVGGAKAVQLSAGLSRREEQIHRKVTVPTNRISGATLDPVKAQPNVASLDSPKIVTNEAPPRSSLGKERIIDTLAGSAEEQVGLGQRPKSRKTGGRTRNGLVLLSLLVVVILFVLVVITIYINMG